MMDRVIICITGLPGAGKSMAAKILSRKGLKVVEMGDVVRKMIDKERLKSSDIRSYSINMRRRHGKTIFAKKTIGEIKKAGKKNVIVAGLRSKQELKLFRDKLKKVYLLALVAPTKLRFQRVRHRKNHEDMRNIKKFSEREEQEKTAYATKKSEKRNGVPSLIENADFVVYNTGSIADLTRGLNTVLDAIKERG